MSRRPRAVMEQVLTRRLGAMAPGGMLASESPVRRAEGALRPPRAGGMGGASPRWWSGSWTGATLTVPSGPAAGDLVFVVVDEASGANDYFDDPTISATWDQWASRGSKTWGVFTHDGRSSYTISTEAPGGAFVFVCNGVVAYDNLLDEGDTGPIQWYSESGETFTLTGSEQAHLLCGWSAEDYDAPYPAQVGAVVVDNPASPLPSPMHSITNPLAGSDYWYAVGALVVSTAR